MPLIPGFVSGTYQSQSVNVAAQRCVNLYPEKTAAPESEEQQNALYPTPGKTLFLDTEIGFCRGLLEHNGRAFGAFGSRFVELFAIGTFTDWGEIGNDALPAQMCANVSGQLLIVSATTRYVFTLATNALVAVAGPFQARMCGFVDGFGIALADNAAEFVISANENFLTWDPLDNFPRSFGSDQWRSMLVNHKEIWLFGGKTSEVWVNTGDADNPFQPIPNVFLPIGIGPRFSGASIDGTPYWISENQDGALVAVRANGYNAERISTHSIEWLWSQYATTNDAIAWSEQHHGHTWWVIDFPAEGHTWVYDLTTQSWHERGIYDGTTGEYTSDNGWYHMFAFGKHLVGDHLNGHVYVQSVTTYDNHGTDIRRMRRFPHVSHGGVRWFHNHLRIGCETGVGTSTIPTPQMMLRYSNDGGHTWSNAAWRSVGSGAIGEYWRRVIWGRLGSAYDRIYEVAMTDRVPWRLFCADLDVTKGTH